MEKQFSTEFHFLLLCLQSQRDPQKAAAIQRPLTSSELDWKQLRLLIRSHKVSSLVYESLAEIPGSSREFQKLAYCGV